MSELKPCPYCGGEDAYNVYLPDPYSRDQYAWVNCKTCNASGGQFVQRVYPDDKSFSRNEMELESTKLWNTRPIEDALHARIAELEGEVTKGHELQDSYCDRIAELEAERRWHVVADGDLPNTYKPVLTVDMSEATRIPVPAFYNLDTNCWYTHFEYDLWVTHWMPLSELPEVK